MLESKTVRLRSIYRATANLGTNIMDFRGFDLSIILTLRGGILKPIGDIPESLSQAMLVGVMLVGGLGVLPRVVFDVVAPQVLRFLSVYILQRGVLWKQGVVVYIIL